MAKSMKPFVTTLALAEQLVDRLGGATGASRAEVETGFAPNAIQLGQTGKAASLAVHFAFGISVADVSLVGDRFEVLLALTSNLPLAARAA